MLTNVGTFPSLEVNPGGRLTSDGQAVVECLHKGNAEGHKAMACIYEYARHSEVLCRLAAFHRTGDASAYRGEHESVHWQIVKDTLGVATSEPFAFDWLWHSIGDYFPERPWRDIPPDRRPPPHLHDKPLPALNTRQFANYGERARADNESCWRDYLSAAQEGVGPFQAGPPSALFREGTNGERLVVAFHLDLTSGKAALKRQFAAFLDSLPENEGVLKSAAREASERSARPADWLRDLALWRLRESLGTKSGAVREWIVARGINPKTGEPLAMRDGRRQDDGSHDVAACMDSSLKAAANRMKRNLRSLLPFEVLPERLADEKAAFSDRIGKLWDEHFGAWNTAPIAERRTKLGNHS